MINHNAAHYLAHIFLAAGIGAVLWAVHDNLQTTTARRDAVTAASHESVPLPVPRKAWLALTPTAVVKLGETLKAQDTPPHVDIWCPDLSCQALAADIADGIGR